MKEIKGWHVLTAFVFAFGIIITANVVMAVNAVSTFPGLEVKNSYIASQSFDVNRKAQEALEWQVRSWLENDRLHLEIRKRGVAIDPQIEEVVFGRPTSVREDQTPDFSFDGQYYVADVKAGPGNWNLRVKLRAEDGTLFSQRIALYH